MSKRRKARELALQFLFQLDINPPGGANEGTAGDDSDEAVVDSVGEIVTEIANENVSEIVAEKVTKIVNKGVIKKVTKKASEIATEDTPEIVNKDAPKKVIKNGAFKKSTPNNIKMMIDNFWDSFKTDNDLRPFFVELIDGVTKNRVIIDKQINEVSENWKLNRMSVVDRNILRFSIFELMFVDDIPPSVTMNEAIEIAKRYGTTESPSFINGILDKVANRLPKS